MKAKKLVIVLLLFAITTGGIFFFINQRAQAEESARVAEFNRFSQLPYLIDFLTAQATREELLNDETFEGNTTQNAATTGSLVVAMPSELSSSMRVRLDFDDETSDKLAGIQVTARAFDGMTIDEYQELSDIATRFQERYRVDATFDQHRVNFTLGLIDVRIETTLATSAADAFVVTLTQSEYTPTEQARRLYAHILEQRELVEPQMAYLDDLGVSWEILQGAGNEVIWHYEFRELTGLEETQPIINAVLETFASHMETLPDLTKEELNLSSFTFTVRFTDSNGELLFTRSISAD